MSQVTQNIRIRFSKQGDVRFISHHDLMRLFERAVRRADLPIAMSEGHNPRPRISFPIALSVGLSGLNEVVDLGLREWTRPDDVRQRFQAELPEGLLALAAEVTQAHPPRQPREIAYRVPLLPGHALTQEGVDGFLAAEQALVRRRRREQEKQVEIRQFVKAIRLGDDEVRILLRCADAGTARPEEVMAAMGGREGVDYRTCRIERTHVNLAPSR